MCMMSISVQCCKVYTGSIQATKVKEISLERLILSIIEDEHAYFFMYALNIFFNGTVYYVAYVH